MNSAIPLILLLATGGAAKPRLASLLRHEMLGEPEADGAVVGMTSAAAAARTFDAVSWLMRSTEGFCGLTEEAESTAATCSQASQGQWPLAKPGANTKHGRDWLSATQRCQKLCAQCARCRYISVSVRHGDCSWFESCDAPAGLLHTVSGFRTALARNASHAARLHRQHAGSPVALTVTVTLTLTLTPPPPPPPPPTPNPTRSAYDGSGRRGASGWRQQGRQASRRAVATCSIACRHAGGGCAPPTRCPSRSPRRYLRLVGRCCCLA